MLKRGQHDAGLVELCGPAGMTRRSRSFAQKVVTTSPIASAWVAMASAIDKAPSNNFIFYLLAGVAE